MRPTPLPCSKLYSRQSVVQYLHLGFFSSFYFLVFFLLPSFFLLLPSFFWLLCNLKPSVYSYFFLPSFFLLLGNLKSYSFFLLLCNLKSYYFFLLPWGRIVLMKRERDGTSVAWGQDKRVVLQVLILWVHHGAVWMTSLLLSLFHISSYGSVWGRCLAILVFIVAFGTW